MRIRLLDTHQPPLGIRCGPATLVVTVSAKYDTDFFVTWAFSAWIRIFPDRILADPATGKKVLSGSGKKDPDPTHRKVKLPLL